MERTDGVETFVGIDAHSKQCSIKAITRQGEELREVDVPTRGAALRKALQGLPRPVWAIVESSYLAPLMGELIEGSVERLIVCETRENRWISHSDDKGDQADADPAMAKRTVARKILATALVLMKTGAAYEDDQV